MFQIDFIQSTNFKPKMLGTTLKSSYLAFNKTFKYHNTSPKLYKTQTRNLTDNAMFASACASTATVAMGMFLIHRYKVSKPNEYLVRTGLFIRDIKISKKGMQWPFQKYQFINMEPKNYTFNLHAMSSQKMQFVLPGVFTIGPKDDNDALRIYSRLLGPESDIDTLVKGVIEGQTRTVASNLTIEEIFAGRDKFKEEIIRNVQSKLDQMGLVIYDANIKEMQDSPGSEYFEFLRQKTKSVAENKAKVDVSEATKLGQIGAKEREAETRKRLAEYEADTVLRENEKRQEIETSNADLEVVKAEAFKKQEMAIIEARKATEIRNAELQRQVEEKRVMEEIERLRAKELSMAQVLAESKIKEAEGEANALRLKAEAVLYSKQKEAEGIYATYKAQSEGLEKLVQSLGGNQQSLVQYLMLDKDIYPRLAQANAEAIRDMKPKVTVWQTGNDSSNNVTQPIRDILKCLPPLFDTIHDQTGLKPGNWLLQGLDKSDKQ